MKDRDDVIKWLRELVDDHGAASGMMTLPTGRPQTVGLYDINEKRLYAFMITEARVEAGQPG